MSVRILTGDCRATLRTLPERSVHTVITSPPYYGLRSYPGDPLLWGDQCCPHAHEWGDALGRTKGGSAQNKGLDNADGYRQARDVEAQTLRQGQFCQHAHQFGARCEMWRGMLGLEPTPELYIQHLVECFREVRRVLRDDGTLWVNIGDSYSGSHGNGYKQTMHSVNYTGGDGENFDLGKQIDRDDGCKPKDLLMIPAQVAIALRKDGWYLRSQIPWVKRNCMPESVRDRPTNAVEYVFLLSKSRHYYYDSDAVRVSGGEAHAPGNRRGRDDWESIRGSSVGKGMSGHLQEPERVWGEGGRSRRNSEWFFEDFQGLLADDDGGPLALVVNPTGYKEAHYATFAPKFVEPMIKASTSEKGVCPECGNPWARQVEKQATGRLRERTTGGLGTTIRRETHGLAEVDGTFQEGVSTRTLGWQPTCSHDLPPVSSTVLDCFGGAGTVAMVADRLGRDGISCELSEVYSQMSDSRAVNDMPMFADVQTIAAPKEPDELTDADYVALPLFDI